jgi:pimeloyl-ACP methyl ester carboxylesterase
VALDLPGHGHADGPGERQLAPGGGPREAAADVAVALRALAPRAHGVVGMSFGGLTAIALAAAAPELVRRLVLVDVLPGLSAEHARHIGAFLDGPPTFASFDDLLARTMAFNPQRSESSLRRGILHNALQLPDGSWVWRHARWRRGTGGDAGAGGAAAAAEGGADAARTTLHDELAGDLAGLRMPVLLARGLRSDSVLRDADEDRFRALLPDGQVQHFAEAGHSIQGDMPVELAAAIEAFVP